MSLDLEKEGRLREEINMLKNADKTMDKIVALCKNRGFIFAGSEIYGGLANTWDYGPLGVELKNNVKKAWWKKFVQESPYNVGQDAAILMNPQVWVASGHVTTFNDPLIDCKACKMRHRADQLIENYNAANGIEGVQVEAMDQDSLVAYIREKKIPCHGCGKSDFPDIRKFNLMLKYWRTFCHNWLLGIGLKDENLRLRDHDPEELCFYSKATTDFEFLFPFGWGELWGVADRTDYDLTQHEKTSGQDLKYFDQEAGEHYVPYVVEPSLGADRVTLAFLVDAYDEEVVGQDKKGADDVRTVLHLHPALAPYKAAVLPLSKKLSGKAEEIYHQLQKDFMVDFDDTGSIGKRYRRQDEIGTPLCITVDFQTVGDETAPADHCVTVRDRDTMEQVRLPIENLKAYLTEKTAF